MTYADLPIHQRINAKGNAITLYGMYSYVLMRVCAKDPARYSPSLLLKKETFREPKNAGNPKY
jgi:hypothetical protein